MWFWNKKEKIITVYSFEVWLWFDFGFSLRVLSGPGTMFWDKQLGCDEVVFIMVLVHKEGYYNFRFWNDLGRLIKSEIVVMMVCAK